MQHQGKEFMEGDANKV